MLTTLIEEIFAVESMLQIFHNLLEEIFADATLPKISLEFIFADTNKENSYKQGHERNCLNLHFHCIC